MRTLVSALLLIAALCSGNVRAQQVETSLPISQRLSINLAAGVPQYVGDASSTSNAPQSHWWFENTNNSTTYSTPGFVEGSEWQQIGLPYDANIPRTFINQASGGGQGSLTGQENWYRLHFKVDPKYAGQKFMLNIEGSHTAVQVFINGTLLKGISAVAADAQATHVVGFIPVIVDLTPYIHADGTSDNVIAIDVSRGDPWFEQPAFSGAFRFGQAMAGLFRNVHLYITNPVHIPVNSYSNQATWGTYVGTVSEVPAAQGTATAASAVVEVQTNVLNEMTTAQPVTLTTQIVDANGNVVVTAPPITQSVPPMTPGNFPSGPTPMFDQMITVPNPTLWYPNNSIYGKPYMYRVYHIVSVNGVVVDAAQSPLGIRTLTWDANFPYFNGHAMYLWGGSSRYDYPALGSSIPDEQWWRDMAQIAAQGGNVWRVGHSTSSEELVEAADAYGIMIDQPSGDGEGYWNNPSADDTQLKLELHRDMIIRDRSHPSILDWEEDNGGMNQPLADQLATLETQWDNINPRVQADRAYKPSYADMDECDGAGCEAGNKEQNEGNPAFGAEYWDNMGTGRGLAWDYELAFAAPYLNDWRQGRAANAFGMAQWYFADSPGEISLYAEYQNQPNMNNFVRSLGYSSVDMNRFPRLLYYIYQANWVPYSIQPVVHLAHHWNRAYEYTPNTPIQENAFSNCPSVRLLINGVAKDPVTGAALADQTPNPWNISSNTDLTQSTTVMPGQVHWMVNWAPGSVTAECIDDYGNVVPGASDTRTTAGPENKIVLSVVPEVTRPDGTSFQWTANGSDAAFIQAQVQDANGNLVPTAADNVTFSVTGPATYMGGSQQLVADPSWTNYYQDAFSQANSTVIGGLPYAFFHSPGDPELNFEGGLQKIALRSTFSPGTVTVTATAPGLASGSVQLASVTPPAPSQNQPPAIIVPPVNAATTVGYPATFTVAASGSGTLTYQWYVNNSAVSGATGTTYTTPPTTLAENGEPVAVTITNAFGTTSSTPVVLSVDAAANVAITTQPASQTAVVGQSATLTVVATGSPAINYAWYENGTLVQSGPQASFTTPSLTATGTDTFYVIVSNPSSQVQSSTAVLTVNAPTPVSITSQPVSQIVAANLPVQLTAVVGGSAPYTYQWRFTPTGGSPTILVSNSQTSNTISYSIPAMSSANVGSYTVTVNNAANTPVTSAAATLTLAPPGLNLALDKVATSSSTQNACTNATTTPPFSGTNCLGPENAVDGSLTTRWGSATAGGPPTPPIPGVDPSWLQVDLGSVLGFNTVIINWENAYAAQYQIQYTSQDPSTNPTWNVAYTNTSGTGGTETLNFPTVQARYIRMYATQRATQYGYSIYEFQVYNVPQCGGPNERYTVNSANSSLVLDNLSGLTWTRTIETDTAAGSQFTGVSAAAYCSSINMRLPTQAEALGISGNNDASCAVHGTWSTWTSTVDPNDASETAIVNFDGTSTWNVTNNYPGATLCVAGAAGTPPAITTQPVSQTVSLGQTATFSVAASGPATFGYQWYKNGAVVGGGNTATYTTPPTLATDNGAAFTVAVSNAGQTVLSDSATLTVTGISCASAPSVPGSVTASATSSSQISLTWGASTAGPNCSVGYNVYRSTAAGFTPGAGNKVATSQTGTTFADTGLTPSTTYYYIVEAVDAYGMSAASNQASAATLASGTGSGPTFTVGVSTPSLTVTAGTSGTEIITLTPENGFPTTSPITFVCSGLPTGAACAFSPATASQAGNMVSTLTITTTAQSAAVRSGFGPGQWFGGAALAGMLVLFGGKKRRSVQLMLLLMALCLAGISVTGCGVTTATQATQQTNSKITVTATSGSLQQTATFSLTVVSASTAALQRFPLLPWLPYTALAGVLCFFTRKTRYALQYMLLFASLVGISLTGCGKPNAVDDSQPVKPSITTQPASATAATGQTASFSVVATGTAPLTYQWYSNGTAIPGATAANYTTPALTIQNNGANYDVVITNTVGSVTSSIAGLTVTSGSVSCSVVPSIPGSVVASATSSSQIGVSWSASSAGSPCSVTYNVYRSTVSGFTPGASNQVASAQTATSFTDTGLTASTTYYYVVAAADAFGSSAPSTQVSAQTLAATSPPPPSCTTVPATPAGLAPTAASVSTISLSWTADTAPENCSITYSVYGSTTSGFTPSAGNLVASGITATSYTNTGLTASTNYYYVVEAVDTDGSSSPSAQVKDTTTAAASTSTEIVAINSGGPAVSNANGGDASFVADEFYSGGASSNFNGAVATSGIANAAPEGVYQSERNGKFTYTIPGLAPNASYTVLLHFSENYFTAAGSRVFNVAINGTPVLTNFDIYAQAGANTALAEPFTASANQQGQIVIAYTTGSANFPKSSGLEVRGATSACTLLPTVAPTGLTAQATSPSIVNLNWATVTPPPNCPITYNLYGSTTTGFTPSASNLLASGLTNTAYSNTGLAASTTYYYVVEAVDGVGASAPSAQASAATNSATSCIAIPSVAPTSFSATAVSSTAISLNWTAIPAPANCTKITYNIYASTTSGFTPAPTNEIAVNLPNTTFVNNNLPALSTYYYVVQAVDEDGVSSEFSVPASETTLPPPSQLTATAISANEIDLTFPQSTAPAPVQYNVFRSTTQNFTPSGSNQVGSSKSNFYHDVVLSASTTYYYIVQANSPAGTTTLGGPVNATTLALGNAPPFWDASNIPATPAGDVMTFKFLNRTNGQYPDDQVYWSVTVNGVTTTSTIAAQPYFNMPANASGRMYFYLGSVGQNNNNYYDFIEYTIGPTFFNGDTTRVDAFGVKLAFQLKCGDGTDIAVGENAATFAENRATTFQRYLNAVPPNFQALAQNAPYQIVAPGGGGFDAGGPYDTYFNAWIDQIWANNGITSPARSSVGDNGDGLGSYPNLSAAIYRHVGGAAGSFNANGTLANPGLWGNPNTFYQQAPASYYGQFFHANAINGQQYTFPYDDAGGYSSDVGCGSPHTLLVAVGW